MYEPDTRSAVDFPLLTATKSCPVASPKVWRRRLIRAPTHTHAAGRGGKPPPGSSLPSPPQPLLKLGPYIPRRAIPRSQRPERVCGCDGGGQEVPPAIRRNYDTVTTKCETTSRSKAIGDDAPDRPAQRQPNLLDRSNDPHKLREQRTQQHSVQLAWDLFCLQFPPTLSLSLFLSVFVRLFHYPQKMAGKEVTVKKRNRF